MLNRIDFVEAGKSSMPCRLIKAKLFTRKITLDICMAGVLPICLIRLFGSVFAPQKEVGLVLDGPAPQEKALIASWKQSLVWIFVKQNLSGGLSNDAFVALIYVSVLVGPSCRRPKLLVKHQYSKSRQSGDGYD